jgi:hypothetical protein
MLLIFLVYVVVSFVTPVLQFTLETMDADVAPVSAQRCLLSGGFISKWGPDHLLEILLGQKYM